TTSDAAMDCAKRWVRFGIFRGWNVVEHGGTRMDLMNADSMNADSMNAETQRRREEERESDLFLPCVFAPLRSYRFLPITRGAAPQMCTARSADTQKCIGVR